MKNKHSNIPIFIPELACPHQCVFCNQKNISGQEGIVQPHEIQDIIDEYLSTMNDGRTIEIAFFGGSFTGIDIKLQEEYLKIAHAYILSGKVHGIRLSTRPDYIDQNIIQLLKKYGVTAVELGAQSTAKIVLQKSGRGHSFEDIKKAAHLIKSAGIELGLQMMIGLPEDTKELSLQTAKDIVALGAETTRIYPTIVVKDTVLEKRFLEGLYQPLSLETAVDWTKDILSYFSKHDIHVLRVGLHPSEDLVKGKNLISGPLHPAFKELVMSDIWHQLFEEYILPKAKGQYLVEVANRQLNYAVGFKGKNKSFLTENGFQVKFIGNENLKGYESKISFCG
ncbi:radical SAM protein [Flammeovirga yaeyamensis]|uniref:Radical SAM protein n=1 Tax=Flammeovirga yaeyamensis TaxID=367791 RepID=A0AAX1NE31_9BACT|nr:radical SAM protein [Flammeovirga yaeyamensis]MBB3699901.1 histone acetyltransferase (RNA polymerase elongator complex component) [Flammeovirga yaeyamensis]NMF38303.1 radical SAM protein [Flammeovirga yaeyamensis]QWG04715.1 radical SAM protein [Flammeovirga yaeyamensis]